MKIKLSDPKQFILGGKAFFALYSEKSGESKKYTVLREEKWFRVLCEQQTLGIIKFSDHQFIVSKYIAEWSSSKRLSANAFAWYWRRVLDGRFKEYLNTDHGRDPFYAHHLGRCGVCGRELEDAESISRGIGPVCLKRIQ